MAERKILREAMVDVVCLHEVRTCLEEAGYYKRRSTDFGISGCIYITISLLPLPDVASPSNNHIQLTLDQ